MSNGNQIAHPPTVMHCDNRRGYRTNQEILQQMHDALKLKQIESQCLADLCRKNAAEIRNKNATIALLQKRLLTATHISSRMAA
jgi:hypothetical protein